MRNAILAAMVAMALLFSSAAKAQCLAVLSGAVLGGLAGSVYVSGLEATAATVASSPDT
jgi:hypothetical protein